MFTDISLIRREDRAVALWIGLEGQLLIFEQFNKPWHGLRIVDQVSQIMKNHSCSCLFIVIRAVKGRPCEGLCVREFPDLAFAGALAGGSKRY